MNQVKNIAKNVTSSVKQRITQMKSDTDAMTVNIGIDKNNKSQTKIQELKREISTLKQEMKDIQVGTFAFESYSNAIAEAETELKQLNLRLKQTSSTTKMISKENSKLSSAGNSFNSATKKIRNYVLALFSIRSAMSLVSRASSAYLSQDTELAGQLQSVWAGLGSFFAPIIQNITTGLMKLVKYLNIFIKAVTGQDLLAKASAKATDKIKAQTKATKSLNKSLSELDEISNISMDENNKNQDQLENPFDNFNDIEIDTSWADEIKEFGEWIKDNKELIIVGISGIALAIVGLKMVASGGVLASFGKGLLGIGIIIIGVAIAIKGFMDYLKDPSWENFGKILAGVGIAILGIGILIGSVPTMIVGAIVLILGIIAKYWNEIWDFLENAKVSVLNWAKSLFGDTLGDIIVDPFIQGINLIQSLFNGLFRGVKDILDGIIKIFKGDFKNGIKQAGRGVVNLLIGLLNGLIDSINLLIWPLRSVIVGFANLIGKKFTMGDVKIPHVPFLDVGTNYVPEDQLAVVHKGEAVVPKKFNSAEYFSNANNNDETNELLMDVNRSLIELVNKDNNLYIDGKNMGKTLYKPIKDEENRLGVSNVVKVR